MRLILLAFAAAAACQSTVKPDDMSAAAHRAEADDERAQARAALEGRAQYRGSREGIPRDERLARSPWGEPYPESQKQAQDPVFHEADLHIRHAREHEHAAAELERFENAACENIPASERAGCPLLRDVTGIADVANGVRVTFGPTVSVDDVAKHIRCHLAYSRARAYADVDECPLYVRGLDVAVEGEHAVRLVAADALNRELTRRIRRLARAQALSSPETR